MCQNKLAVTQVAGFSGTNDNQPLLPLTVKAMPSKEIHIQATDGRMLCLLARSGKCKVMPLRNQRTQQPEWRNLLDSAIQLKAQALIDAGTQQTTLVLCHLLTVHGSVNDWLHQQV